MVAKNKINIKLLIFIGTILLIIVGLALAINFYNPTPTPTAGKGPILNWVCKGPINDAVNAANSQCNAKVKTAVDDANICKNGVTAFQNTLMDLSVGRLSTPFKIDINLPAKTASANIAGEPNGKIALPILINGTFLVDWGDGGVKDSLLTHVYKTLQRTYTITVYTLPNAITTVSLTLNKALNYLTYKESGTDRTYITKIVTGNNSPSMNTFTSGGGRGIATTPEDWGITVENNACPTCPPPPTPCPTQPPCPSDPCPDEGCSGNQVCINSWAYPQFTPNTCSDTFCSSDDDCIKRGGPNKKCAMYGDSSQLYTCVSNYCESDQQCGIGSCVNYRCTGNCIKNIAPLAINENFSIPMQKSNTAYAYVPIEMFEVKSSRFYIYGFWGFIQTSGNQIFANQYIKKIIDYSNPPVDKYVEIVAGGGSPNKPGYRNDSNYQRALFNQPQGLAVCKTINPTTKKYNRPIIFVSDTGNHCIRMISATITPNGDNGNPTSTTRGVSTLTGSKWDGKESFNAQGYSIELPVNSGFQDGNLYEALFKGPTGLDFDSNGVLYVADTGNNSLRKIEINDSNIDFSNNTQPLPQITGKVTTLDIVDLNAPRAVLFNSGMLYVSDATTIRKIDVLNNNQHTIIATGLNNPYGLVFSGTKLLFSDATGVKILEILDEGVNIRPVPNTNFSNRPLALMNYKDHIVVGLEGATAVQIPVNCIT